MAEDRIPVSPDSTGLGPSVETQTRVNDDGDTVHRQIVNLGDADPMLSIPAGLISGYSCVNKFGESPEVASGVREDIWDGQGQYSYPATALVTSMSQTADQALMRGAVI